MSNLLRQTRKAKRLTQTELARLSGISGANLSRLETGEVQRPAWATVRRIAAALKVRPERLFPQR